MFAQKLWADNGGKSLTLDGPSWGDIERAIRQLDGVRSTLVTFGPGEEVAHMAVGGGKGGNYICYITFDNCQFYNLRSEQMLSGHLPMIVGGQEGDYERQQLVDLTTALVAAKTFAERGELDPGVKWLKE